MEDLVLIDYLNCAINELKKIYPEQEVLKLIAMDIVDYQELLGDYRKASELGEKKSRYQKLVSNLKEYEETKELSYFRNFYSEEEISEACNLAERRLKEYKSAL